MKDELLALLLAIFVIGVSVTIILADVVGIESFKNPRIIYQIYADFFITVFIVILSLGLFILALLSYIREKTSALVYLVITFLLFFLRSIMELADLIIGKRTFMLDAVEHVIDFGILVSIVLAVVNKR